MYANVKNAVSDVNLADIHRAVVASILLSVCAGVCLSLICIFVRPFVCLIPLSMAKI